jgi:hypothetical protein
MNKITSSLKKKWGPLPAWAWLLGGGLLYYFYRKYSATSASGTGTGSVAPAAATPQPITTLGAGESAYDPNTGSLVTAPGGGGSADTSSADALTAAMNNLAGAIASGMPDNTDPGSNNPTTNPGAGTPAATTGTGGAKGKPKLTAPGALRAPFGHTKPAARQGYTIKGLGRGFWEYVPKRTPKPKGQPNATKKTSKPIQPGATTRARSTTSVRHTTGGRATARQPAKTGLGHRTTVSRSVSTPQQPSRARQRPRTPAAQQVVQQRRPATMPRVSPTRQTGGVAPRPSAPPPRTQRAPAKPPPKPKPKPRGR